MLLVSYGICRFLSGADPSAVCSSPKMLSGACVTGSAQPAFSRTHDARSVSPADLECFRVASQALRAVVRIGEPNRLLVAVDFPVELLAPLVFGCD